MLARHRRVALCLALAAISSPPAIGSRLHEGSHFPPNFESLTAASGFSRLTGFAFAPDGTLFAVEKHGRIRVAVGSQIQSSAFIDLKDEVNLSGDRGLLSVALSPDFVADGGPSSWVYLAYTVSPVFGEDLDFDEDDKYSFSRITRYRAIDVSGEIVADESTRQILIGHQLPDGTVPDGIASLSASHAMGSMHFADDGSLFIAVGEGAHFDQVDPGGLDPAGFENFVHPVTGLRGPMPIEQDCGSFRAQDVRSLAGKLLRINPETGAGYASNPFFDGDLQSNASKIWALGLRNPFRVNIQPNTGSTDPADGNPNVVLIGDVGANKWEEINVCNGGENFGWPCHEGPSQGSGYNGVDHGANPLNCIQCDNIGPGVLTAAALAWKHDGPELVTPPNIHSEFDGTPAGGFIGSAAIGGALYQTGDYPPAMEQSLFFADYADQWIKLLMLDQNGNAVEVRDFASELGRIVDLQAHPITGDIYYATLGSGGIIPGEIHRIRYGDNLTPTPVAEAFPTFGALPLTVDFDATDSDDPDADPLTFEWDFGDNSPTVVGSTPQHTYVTEGPHTVTLTATDPGGLSAVATIVIEAGQLPPVAEILSPLKGALFSAPTTIPLLGTGSNPAGGGLSYDWAIDLHHDTHVHPEFYGSSGQNSTLSIDPHGSEDDVIYLHVILTVTNNVGISSTDDVFIFPADAVRDVSGTSRLIAQLDNLVPPSPLGTGNPDREVLRDGVFPAVSSTDDLAQFDTFHMGDQGDDDWIGYEFVSPPTDELHFISLQFQEGLHAATGGWFEDIAVEVRENDQWSSVANLSIEPAYPFGLSGQPGFDGTSFNSYFMQFEPIHGDAIRLRGNPGGVDGFISAGELRVRVIDLAEPDDGRTDLTASGEIIYKTQTLPPPTIASQGNPNVQTIRNGTYPEVGSSSLHAQFDTFHEGAQGGEDWIGYRFPTPRTFDRVVFQEGFHYPNGGWFTDLSVEVSGAVGSPWVPVQGLTTTPTFPGDNSASGSYETFTLDFTQVDGEAIRIIGTPGGADGFISIGELRVLGPDGCGWIPFGVGLGGTNILNLSSLTPPNLGAAIEIDVRGAGAPTLGLLFYSLGTSSFPLFGGTVVVDPGDAAILPIAFNSTGSATFAATLPSNPALVGKSFYFQAGASDPIQLGQTLFSNGLELRICP